MSIWCRCPMQGCKCKVYSWWCQCMHSNHDANVSLQRWRCKCLLMGMSWCKCPFIRMPWCKCFDANTIYSKILHVFEIKASLAPKTKIFSNLDLLFLEKSSFFFLLKAPKKLVITVRNLRIGHLLEIWWSGSKDLFSQFGWAKRWHVSNAFFWKTNSLKIKHFKKIHFFLFSKYDNLTSVKTHRDRLKNLGKHYWIESSNSLILERIEEPVEA